MSNFVKESWLMILVSVLSGLAVAGVYRAEKPRIDRNAMEYLNRAVLAVVPGGTTVEPVDLGDLGKVYRVRDASGRFVGWGVPAQGPGFQGMIRLVIGLDPTAKTITGITVVEQSETPGLGSNITRDEWRSQFAGKAAVGEPLEVVKGAPSKPYHIHAITAATISSKAVVSIANKELARIRERLAKEAGL
jgi:electron transport complex protein RnfG